MRTFDQFFADGRLQPSFGGRSAPHRDPVSGELSGEVLLCSAADLSMALFSAQRCAASWANSALDARVGALQRLSAAIEQRSEEFVQAMADDIGCPVWLSRALHVPMALKDLEFASASLQQIQWHETVGNAVVEKVAVGVVGAITPWNAPLHQMVAKIAAAVAAGCAVVLKPSEQAPAVSSTFMASLLAADLPAGLVNVVWGDCELGMALVTDSRVNHISFTGSTAVGKRIMAAAANNVTRISLELGGKSAAVLLDDADLDLALPAVIRSCMANSGQTCVAQTRLVAPQALMPKIEHRLVELVKDWPVGDPRDDATRIGPLANTAQLQHVQRMMAGAIEAGARLLCGGPTDSSATGYFVSPTVFVDVTPSMEIAQCEVFGPVLSVIAYRDEEEAAQIANATPYGLSGAVWSTDLDRAARFARQMRTGQVVVNGAPQNLATPFGGWRLSGMGRENGRYGVEEFLQYRSLHGLSAAELH